MFAEPEVSVWRTRCSRRRSGRPSRLGLDYRCHAHGYVTESASDVVIFEEAGETVTAGVISAASPVPLSPMLCIAFATFRLLSVRTADPEIDPVLLDKVHGQAAAGSRGERAGRTRAQNLRAGRRWVQGEAGGEAGFSPVPEPGRRVTGCRCCAASLSLGCRCFACPCWQPQSSGWAGGEGQLLHRVVAEIGDVDVAARVHRNARGRAEAAAQRRDATGGRHPPASPSPGCCRNRRRRRCRWSPRPRPGDSRSRRPAS